MNIEQVATSLSRHRVVPVVTIESAADAPGLAAALEAGGLPLVEVTFRTDAAADAIRAIRETHPGVLVGAGTVLDTATVDRARAAGAAFIVAPGFNPSVVERCAERGVAVIPGVLTPTEIERALQAGLRLLKLFPAEAAGGTGYLKAISAPYLAARFMPTGGVTPANLGAYLSLPSVAACGGTWIATAAAIREGAWTAVEAAAAEAVAIVGRAAS